MPVSSLGLSNVSVFVDKFLNQISLGKIPVTLFRHLSGQLTLLSVLIYDEKKVQAWLPPLFRVHTYIILAFVWEKRPKASTNFAVNA